jgi:hypothetical protein
MLILWHLNISESLILTGTMIGHGCNNRGHHGCFLWVLTKAEWSKSTLSVALPRIMASLGKSWRSKWIALNSIRGSTQWPCDSSTGSKQSWDWSTVFPNLPLWLWTKTCNMFLVIMAFSDSAAIGNEAHPQTGRSKDCAMQLWARSEYYHIFRVTMDFQPHGNRFTGKTIESRNCSEKGEQ